MKLRTIFLPMLLLAIVYVFDVFPKKAVLGVSTSNISPTTKNIVKIQTVTAFDQKEIIEYENVPFDTKYIDDDEMEYGTEKVVELGIDGTKTITYLLTYWGDEEIDKTLLDTKIDPPSTEIVERGTKIVWRKYNTPDAGELKYWHKMQVWATKYDADCVGCTGRTYTGTEVVKGTCAVDPTVIELGTSFYVNGYGLCRAEDIGGAIKGNDVDLGFENASEAVWGAGYTDIYLLTNAPY